jgi:periplasmic copper chaperone A
MTDRRALAFALMAAVWLLGLELLGIDAAIAHFAPALLIFLPLVGGRYPGDRALVRATRRRQRRRLPRRPAPARRAPRLLPRGGRLVGAALAGRGPPLGSHDRSEPTKGRRMSTRTACAGVLVGALTLALATSASAHITTDPAVGPADGYATIAFQVPHGCEESPTTQLRIQIPPSVASATPAVHPLWNVETKEGKKDPVELHGEKITRGVSEVIYTAKQPLPPDRLDLLPISVKLPAGKAGDPVYFPTIQKCAKGETRWIQIPAEGESEDDLESPAPAVTLEVAEGGHGGSAAAEAEESEPASQVQSAGAVADDDDGAPVWLAVVALAVGAAGLLAGGAALAASRRS